MARTFVIGLTESGSRTTVNEDTFSLGGRVYPDMITGSEEESGQSSAYSQLYVVTQGHGGPGAGDLAGRIIQRSAMDLSDLLSNYKQPSLDFRAFSQDLIREAHERVIRQIRPKNGIEPGASMALLLVDANTASLLNVGETDIFLFRDGKLMQPSLESGDADRDSSWYIGNKSSRMVPAAALSIKQFALRPGDIILLTTGGFNQGYSGLHLSEDLASPDAFAASIRQAQINSRLVDPTANGTVLAVKVRDLELNTPEDRIPEKDVRRTIYHDDAADEAAFAPEPPARKVRPDAPKEESMATKEKKLRRKRNMKTFWLSLFMGFLAGLALILLVWYLILG